MVVINLPCFDPHSFQDTTKTPFTLVSYFYTHLVVTHELRSGRSIGEQLLSLLRAALAAFVLAKHLLPVYLC